VNDEIVLGIGIAGPGRRTLNYESSLQNVHVGDQVNVTLSGGNPRLHVKASTKPTSQKQYQCIHFHRDGTVWYGAPRTASAIYVRTKQIGDEEAVIHELRGDGRHVRTDPGRPFIERQGNHRFFDTSNRPQCGLTDRRRNRVFIVT